MLPLLSSPWALAALAALPALTALYWMRHSYRRVPVSSLALWLDQSESKATGLRLRRLQTPILFFLELAALALLGLAAAGPQLELGRSAPPIVVVLDDSLSMQAGGDDSPRRRALAALERDLGWRSASSVRFVLAGVQPQILGESATSFGEAQQHFDNWRCLAPMAKVPEAIAFANELGGDASRILVVTDRPPTDTTLSPRVVWWSFGEPRANVAIVRAGRTPREDHDQCYFEIANYSPGPKVVTLKIDAGGKETARQQVSLDAKEVRRIGFRAPGDTIPIGATIVENDAFDLDNRAFLAREALPPVRVDVKVSDESLRGSLDKAVKSTRRTLPPGGTPHLVIVDKAELPASLKAETWVLHVLQEEDADAFLGPFVVDRTHPLTEGFGLDGVVWGAGKTYDFPGMPVVMAGNVPLLTDSTIAADQHRLRLRIRPDISTLTQSPAWPTLFWNLIQWRAREMPGFERNNIQLGDAARLTVRPGVTIVSVKAPDGTDKTLAVRGGRVVVAADAIGFYDLGDFGRFGVSVVNGDESDLSTCATGRWGEWPTDDQSAPGVMHLAWILALVILAVLTGHLFLATRSFRG